jgi:cold shock protein
MAKGTVKKWKADRGWGFISPDNGGNDIFVHHTGLRRKPGQRRADLLENQRVEYELFTGEKGLQASDVIVID